MPLLSIDELMDDPDFATDTIALIATTETVGNDGRAVIGKSQPQTFTGTVSPARARDLQRLPEGSNQTGAIVVITSTPLTPGDETNGKPADQILWKGAQYVVTTIDDFSEFGDGFVAVICTLQARQTAPGP